MFKKRDRYLMLTVDTEALSHRATDDHVRRLMLGEQEAGTAGVREMVAIGDEFNAKHIFFVDMCGAYDRLTEIQGVIRYLDQAGHDVQLHTHPEKLPASYWETRGFAPRPRLMNEYTTDARAQLIIREFARLLSEQTGKPVLGHRAGSFRWNASTLRALFDAGIPVSFNNSSVAVKAGQAVYAKRTNWPFEWSNGIIEVPMTERAVFNRVRKDHWHARLTYPESHYFHFRPWWGPLLLNTLSDDLDFAVFLLHSWSFLDRDENGIFYYKDDRKVENYRKLLQRLTKDYDVITTAEFLELQALGKIPLGGVEDVRSAELIVPAIKPKKIKPKTKKIDKTKTESKPASKKVDTKKAEVKASEVKKPETDKKEVKKVEDKETSKKSIENASESGH